MQTDFPEPVVPAISKWGIADKSPIIGIGTGDYPDEYEKVNQIRTPEIATTVQPHNMYILVLSQLGLVGFLSFLWIFIIQFKISLISKSKFVNHVGVALPLLFMVIMWSDSYLLGHYTSNLFILLNCNICKRQNDFYKSDYAN